MLAVLALIPCQEHAPTIRGREDWDDFGHVVAGVGDVDGDGMPDFLIAQARRTWGSPDMSNRNTGTVWILSGRDGHTIQRVMSTSDRDGFGCCAAAAGDIDGDGHADWIVGSENLLPTVHGYADVYSGASGARLCRIEGRVGPLEFGIAVAGIGDADGDGRDDVAVAGSPRDWLGNGSALAAVFRGFDGRRIATIAPPHVGDRRAAGPCAAGDCDGDGRADVALVVTRADGGEPRLIVSSGRDGHLLSEIALPAALSTPRAGIDWPQFEFLSLVTCPDADGDHIPELCVAHRDGTVVVIGSCTHAVLFQLPAQSKDEIDLGAAVVCPGNIDGDGRPKICVGVDAVDLMYGEVRTYDAETGRLVRGFKAHIPSESLSPAFESYSFGSALDVVGDLDGDGAADLICGVDHLEANVPGCAFVVSGRTGRPLFTVRRYGSGLDLFVGGHRSVPLDDLFDEHLSDRR